MQYLCANLLRGSKAISIKLPIGVFSVGAIYTLTIVIIVMSNETSFFVDTESSPHQHHVPSCPRPATQPRKVLPWDAVVKRRKPPIDVVLKPKQPVIKRYFTAGVAVNEKNARRVDKERSPFSYPKDMELFAFNIMNKAWREDKRVKELKQKYYERCSHKDRQNNDLLKRLYVKEAPMGGMKTITDINPNYHTIVQGRPINDNIDIREYIQTIRNNLRTSIVIGYREDDITLIDETLTMEQAIIDVVKENLQSYINIFESFLLDDHTSAMKLLKEADDASKITYEKYLEQQAVAQKYASLNSGLFNIEDKWRLCKTYQMFLYSVSPMSWRIEQRGSQRRTSIYKVQDVSDEFAVSAYRSSILAKGVSLADIVQEFVEEVEDCETPELYFTSPDELMEVFRFMEMQNLNSLLHSEEMARPLESIKDGMKLAVENFDKEIKNLQEVIEVLEKGISWEESRVQYFEEMAKNLLNKEFKNLIIEEDVLNLQVIVEDLYESRIGQNDANIDMAEMMKAIEELYRHELLFFDKIPSKELQMLEGSYYEEEIMAMKLAERATKQYEDLERITGNLKRALDPPVQKVIARALVRRTPPVNPPKKVQLPPRSLTNRELDYLEYFTEFCFSVDDPKDYGIDTSPESVEKRISIVPVESPTTIPAEKSKINY